MPLTLPFPYNDRKWYSKYIDFHMDRLAVLSIVGSIQIALRHPDMWGITKETLRLVGGALAQRLFSEGLIIPGSVRESWERAFRIKLDEGGRIIRES